MQTHVRSTSTPPFKPLQCLTSTLFSACAAALLLTCPPAHAELQTVPADQIVSMAKPLPQQTVNKGRIWLLFILGASALFGGTVVLENNEEWFPAITRANKAMKGQLIGASAPGETDYETRNDMNSGGNEFDDMVAVASGGNDADIGFLNARNTADPEERTDNVDTFEERLEIVEKEREMDTRLENAVAEGLIEARQSFIATTAAVIGADAVATVEHEDEDAPSSVYPEELFVPGDDRNVEESDRSVGAMDGEERWESRTPLFELTENEIKQRTSINVRKEILSDMSEEDLLKELERRRKIAAGVSNDD